MWYRISHCLFQVDDVNRKEVIGKIYLAKNNGIFKLFALSYLLVYY